MTVEWNDDAVQQIQKEAIDNLRGIVGRAVAGVLCPDHGEAIRFVPGADEESIGRIEGCCEKAVQLGQQAMARALR